MKYEVVQFTSKSGNTYYVLYVVEDDKRFFVTSFFENKYNRKAFKALKECVCK